MLIVSPIPFTIPEPYECPSIYNWIQTCLVAHSLVPFITLPELVRNSGQLVQDPRQWLDLTPRTLLFVQFFNTMQPRWSPAQFVEALSAAGLDLLLLETLPEAVLAPLQEAIVQCQTEPPTSWSKDLLDIIGREDVNMLLIPGQRPHQAQSNLLVRYKL
jgi:anaphase-promoting complex subunit 1